jgi:hypothetical protein
MLDVVYTECHICHIVMPNVVMLCVIMPSVIMLNVVMLTVVALACAVDIKEYKDCREALK